MGNRTPSSEDREVPGRGGSWQRLGWTGLLLLCSWITVHAAKGELSDHPMVSPYEGSVLREHGEESFNVYRRIVGLDASGPVAEEVQGKVNRLRYDNPKGRSTLEIERNYRQALAARGLVVDFECAGRQACGHNRRPGWVGINGLNLGVGGDVRYFTGRMPAAAGSVYISVAVNPQRTFLHIVEPGGMQSGKVSINLDELAGKLEQHGSVELPGIYFDSGTAVLQASSNPALDIAAQLLHERPTWKMAVVGHTDNQGTEAFNQQLSQQRADAVVQALVARGVGSERLESQGMGLTKPVADNATEAGRARNRRVELVRR
ncbi:MAG: OmpA family protein [Burkholderiales bacterium]|nr:MAG: OmpA family protein [Burkholderiales bacterium]